ncbi:hypothetical protein [Photobacterium leiognathi]|uniref:hypothetical protein n=1 Tax=Photobacterium leiognathi TaxID=553611 RepID=UPI000D1556A4|nr:hypothetical protein [Photobacterium leiognathi]PSW53048.1 hypothetical protein C0W50_19765 [Photobacterium leiognathi subsp. mandapamensis]
MNNANLINQTSGDVEWYTPDLWVNAAREVMGSIELDPASSFTANLTVLADRYFDQQTDGLAQPWIANTLWMNHPFHRGEAPCPSDRSKCKKKSCVSRGYHIDKAIPSNMDWVNKLISEYQAGNVREAICISFASTSEGWFRKLLKYPQCFPDGRVQYHKPDGSLVNNVTKGSCITYLGPNYLTFADVFKRFGTVKIAI